MPTPLPAILHRSARASWAGSEREETMARIGFLGLGNMGLPMAANLAKAGHEVEGWDIAPAARQRFAARGGRLAADAAHAAAGAEAGFAMLDAPVSGGVAGAEAASLTFMVGGPAEAFARARPVLAAMGRTIVHAGAAGNGQAAKICNNMILGTSMIAVCEAFGLAEKLGLHAQTLFDISAHSSG